MPGPEDQPEMCAFGLTMVMPGSPDTATRALEAAIASVLLEFVGAEVMGWNTAKVQPNQSITFFPGQN